MRISQMKAGRTRINPCVPILFTLFILLSNIFFSASLDGKNRFPNPSMPFDESSLELKGIFGGFVSFAAKKGQYAFIAQGQRMVVLNLESSTQQPETTLNLKATAMTGFLEGDYITLTFATSGYEDTLMIVDISDPLNPFIASKTRITDMAENETLNQIWVSDGYAYVAMSSSYYYHQKLIVINIQDPGTPFEEARYTMEYLDFFVSGNHAYILKVDYPNYETATLSIMDVSDKSNFQERGSVAVEDGFRISGNTPAVFVACWSGGGLKAIDATDVNNPTISGTYGAGSESFQQVANDENHAYLRDASTNLVILDISNLSSIQFVSRTDVGSFSLDDVIGDSLYFRKQGQFQSVDVSDPSSPVVRKPYDVPAYVTSMAIGHDRLYCPDIYSTVWIFDLSDPAASEMVTTMEVDNANKVFINNPILFVTDTKNHCTLFDLSNRDAPNQLSTLETSSTVINMGFQDRHAFMLTSEYDSTEDQSYLDIVDLANLSNPVKKASYLLPGDGIDLFVPETGDLIYVVYQKDNTTKGFEIIDISSPTAPVSVSKTNVTNNPKTILVIDSTLFLGTNHADDNHAIIEVYDVGDPSSPIFEQSHVPTTDSEIYEMLYLQNTFVLSLPEEGIQILGYDFDSQEFIEGSSVDIPSPRSLVSYSVPHQGGLARTSLPLQYETYVYTNGGMADGPKLYGNYGCIVVKLPWEYPIPTLTVSGSRPREALCPHEAAHDTLLFLIAKFEADLIDGWDLEKVNFKASGTGDDFTDIKEVRVLFGGNPEFQGKFPVDNGTIEVDLKPPIPIGPGSSISLYVVYFQFDIDTATYAKDTTRTFIIETTSVSATPHTYPLGRIEGKAKRQDLAIASVFNTKRFGFSKIQWAIDSETTQSGDSCIVCPGIYEENLKFDGEELQKDNITIISEKGRGQTIIQSKSSSDVFLIREAKNLTIQGFTFRGYTIPQFKTGISVVHSDNVDIIDNAIDGDFLIRGILFEITNNSYIGKNIIMGTSLPILINCSSDNQIKNNQFVSLGGNQTLARQSSIQNSDGLVIMSLNVADGNEISGHNLYEGNILPVIELNLSDNNILTDNKNIFLMLLKAKENRIFNNTFKGMELFNSDNNRIIENTIRQSRSDGIKVLYYSARNFLKNNTISNNAECGIFLKGAQNIKIYKNEIYNNGRDGIRAEDFCINLQVSTNKIFGHDKKYKGENTYGIYLSVGERGYIVSNNVFRNCTGIDTYDCRYIKISCNNVNEASCNFTGIHLDGTDAEIYGNNITNNDGNGILVENGSNPIVTHNNIYGNTEFGLNNADASITIDASGNWWGDAGGPGDQDISGNINAASWFSQPVSLVASAESDSVYLSSGTTDSVFVYFQNLQNFDDAVDLTISETLDWVEEPTSFSMAFEDSVGASVPVKISVPVDFPEGSINRIRVTGVSQSDPNATASDSLMVIVYGPQLASIEVRPDSAVLNPGETYLFTASGYDQHGNIYDMTAVWTATGGTIDSTGLYTAGTQLGTFTVTASDVSGQVQGQAVVKIVPETFVRDEGRFLPNEFRLHQNYPNPFNPETTIRFDVKERTSVVLRVHDMLGRDVLSLVDDEYDPGRYSVTFDASRFSTGLYIYRIQMGSFSESKKMVFLK